MKTEPEWGRLECMSCIHLFRPLPSLTLGHRHTQYNNSDFADLAESLFIMLLEIFAIYLLFRCHDP